MNKFKCPRCKESDYIILYKCEVCGQHYDVKCKKCEQRFVGWNIADKTICCGTPDKYVN